jgi:hypothetical protein
MNFYVWTVEYVKYTATYRVKVVATSIPQIFKDFGSKLRKEYLKENAIISIVRDEKIDWLKRR